MYSERSWFVLCTNTWNISHWTLCLQSMIKYKSTVFIWKRLNNIFLYYYSTYIWRIEIISSTNGCYLKTWNFTIIKCIHEIFIDAPNFSLSSCITIFLLVRCILKLKSYTNCKNFYSPARLRKRWILFCLCTHHVLKADIQFR